MMQDQIRELEDERILEKISQMMEEMAGAPRTFDKDQTEPHVRQPGERGMYERQTNN